MLNRIAHGIGLAYLRRLTKTEASRQRFERVNERPVEYGFAFHWLNRLQPRTVLDVGTGKTSFPALLRTCGFVVTAIDNGRDYWPTRMVNRHWHVIDEDVTVPGSSQSYDVVVCLSVLEHIRDSLAAVRGLYTRTTPGGHVILTTPFGRSAYPNVYEEPGSYGKGNAYICRQHTPTDLNQWLHCGLEIVHAEYWRAFNSDIWSVGSLVRPLVPSDTPAHLGCFVLRRRHDR